jgi:hypothetical protein
LNLAENLGRKGSVVDVERKGSLRAHVPGGKPEKLALTLGTLVVTLEAGVGTMTTPLLAIDAQLSLTLTNWSNDVRSMTRDSDPP